MSQPALKETQAQAQQPHSTGQLIPFPTTRDTSALDHLQSMEADVASETVSEIDLIQKMHPDWYAQYEDTDIATTPSTDLMELLKSAPNSFAKGLIGGALGVRLNMAAISGKAF